MNKKVTNLTIKKMKQEGTPISMKDRSTREVFGDYIDVYDMTQAVEDGATVIRQIKRCLIHHFIFGFSRVCAQ